MDRKIRIKPLNTYITCNICKGYLIGATAITECLHTFCKSCLIKHLECNTTCPTCNIIIHHSYPRQYIKFDRTLQDIVYKLIPNLQRNEIEREKDFYRQRGLPYPIDVLGGGGGVGEEQHDLPTTTTTTTAAAATITSSATIDQKDELITIRLDCINTNSNLLITNSLKKKFIRIKTKATILHLMRLIADKLLNRLELYKNIEIYCNSQLLERSDTLKYVYLTKWKIDDVPLILQYNLQYCN